MGIEPTQSAWKAEVLPLNYARISLYIVIIKNYLVEGGGFEPPKAEPSDLQSDPFGRSGTPPKFVKLLVFCLTNYLLSTITFTSPRLLSPKPLLYVFGPQYCMELATGVEPATG